MPGMEKSIRLSSSDLSNLYNAYINNTMGICIMTYFLHNVEDTEVRPIVEESLRISSAHLEDITGLFNKEGIVIPTGFPSEKHVNLQADKLFHDPFYLQVILNFSKFGIISYGEAVVASERKDVRELFIRFANEAMNLHDHTKQTMLEKGIYVRSPYISYPEKIEFVEKQSFLTGWLGNKRPLTATEMSHLFITAVNNELGKTLLIGFSLCTKDSEIREYMVRGARISKEIIHSIHDLLWKDDVPFSMTWLGNVEENNVSPFSDHLMLAIAAYLSGISITMYGSGLAMSMRRDVAAQFGNIITKASTYAEDGLNIMIDRGWLELPPHTDVI